MLRGITARVYVYIMEITNNTNTIVTAEFIKAMASAVKAAQPSGRWVNMADCPASPIGYSVTPTEDGTFVKFDQPVSDGKYTARRWRVYPISRNKPEGQMNAMRA
jgi:hypothetical protein